MKNKPLLNESTVRKFMKLANLGRVGEGFIAENYNQEETLDEENELEESELAEDKNFGGTKDHKMKPLKAGKKSSAKVMKEEDSLEEQEEMVPGDEDAGAETPDMGDAPEIEPATEPAGEMDASDLAQKIIDVLQSAGLVDIVDDEDGEGGEDVNVDLEEPEEEDENYMDDSQYEEEGNMMENKRAKLARVIAERVKARISRESKIERLAETITNRVIARAKRGR